MLKKTLLILLLFVVIQNTKAQKESIPIEESAEIENSRNLLLSLNITNRYLWRGQVSGGEYITFQPTIEYAFTDNFRLGIMGSTNFKNSNYKQDGYSPKGYNEINIYAIYYLNDYLSLRLDDYYWPDLDDNEEVDNNFFNYSDDGVKTLDLNLAFDFSKIWLPFNATISTFIAGNDFRYDINNENPKRNFTTYLELGYTFKNVLNNLELSPTIGAILNNQAEYYSYADYEKVSLVNLKLELSKKIELNNYLNLPISLGYIHNAADKNTEDVGRNFFVAKLSLEY